MFHIQTKNVSHDLELKFECIAKWLSCNGELWGVGPTAVFASAAALFLYNELEATILLPGENMHIIAPLEKSLILIDQQIPYLTFTAAMEENLVSTLSMLVSSAFYVEKKECTMMLGMLALMIHLWVCCMRFVQYYLETLIKDSPSVLLELTTAGLFGSQANIVPLGPLTRFLRNQQPQIHITVCWFLSLCYADYVRKHYCRRFNLPYLEQWQTELQDRALRVVRQAMEKVNHLVERIHTQLRGYTQTNSQIVAQTDPEHINTVGASLSRERQLMSTKFPATCPVTNGYRPLRQIRSCLMRCESSANQATLLQTLIRNSQTVSRHQDIRNTTMVLSKVPQLPCHLVHRPLQKKKIACEEK